MRKSRGKKQDSVEIGRRDEITFSAITRRKISYVRSNSLHAFSVGSHVFSFFERERALYIEKT